MESPAGVFVSNPCNSMMYGGWFTLNPTAVMCFNHIWFMFCLEKCPSPGKTITFIFFLLFLCFPRGKYCTWIPWWLVLCKRWIFARCLSVQLFGSLGVCILQDSRGKFHPCILTSPFLPQAGYSSQDMDLCPATTHMEPQKQSARGGAEIAAKSCIFFPLQMHMLELVVGMDSHGCGRCLQPTSGLQGLVAVAV